MCRPPLSEWMLSYHGKTRTSKETARCLPESKAGVIYTEHQLTGTQKCVVRISGGMTVRQQRSSIRDKRHRRNVGTCGIAEPEVRRVKEGTSAIFLQSGLGEKWWIDPKECYCCLRNIKDLSSDRKTSCGRRFGDIFLWTSGRSGAGKIARARSPCSKTQREGGLAPNNGAEFIFPCTDGTLNLAGKDQKVRTSIPARNLPEKGEGQWCDLQGDLVGSVPPEQP